MKLIQLEEYVGITVDNPCTIRTIQVNPNNIEYMYKDVYEGKTMTVLVFTGNTKVVVLESMDKIKKILEETRE